MSFYNKKEEVIDIVLTHHGKNLLNNGKFRPFYYAFFDDGIVYDRQYLGLTENQNKSQDRIAEAQSIKTPTVFYGSESKIHNFKNPTFTETVFENTDAVMTSVGYVESLLGTRYMLYTGHENQDTIPEMKVRVNGLRFNVASFHTRDSRGLCHPEYYCEAECKYSYSLSEEPIPEHLSSGQPKVDYYSSLTEEARTNQEFLREQIFVDPAAPNQWRASLRSSGVDIVIEEENEDPENNEFEVELYLIRDRVADLRSSIQEAYGKVISKDDEAMHVRDKTQLHFGTPEDVKMEIWGGWAENYSDLSITEDGHRAEALAGSNILELPLGSGLRSPWLKGFVFNTGRPYKTPYRSGFPNNVVDGNWQYGIYPAWKYVTTTVDEEIPMRDRRQLSQDTTTDRTFAYLRNDEVIASRQTVKSIYDKTVIEEIGDCEE